MACGKMTILSICIFLSVFLCINGQKRVIDLTEDNWTEILNNEWMVEFYAPWCPACKALQQTWADFATLSPGLGIKVGKVDVTTSPGLSGRFMVTALPTIFHVLNGEFRQYKGSRDKDSFISFVEEKKWQQVEAIPGWKSPNSFQMTFVSSFFKLSQTLRLVHNKLMEDFGLPTWGSYLIFAIATIFMGAVLGLVLVCIIDLIYPPKSPYMVKKNDGKKKDKDSDEELPDEDIRDDLIDDASGQSGDEENRSGTGTENSQTESEPNEAEPTGSGPNSPKKVKKRKNRRLDM